MHSIDITGVYVHRLTQVDVGYDGYGGLITTRNRYQGNNITNVTISRLAVPNLGGLQSLQGTRGPNAVYRLFAFGFFCGGPGTGQPDYCGARRATRYSHVSLRSSDLWIAPLASSLFYEVHPGAAEGSMRSVSFMRVDSPSDFNYRNYNQTAVKIHPLPSSRYFYCVNADPQHPERGVDSDVIDGSAAPRLKANVEYQTPYGNRTLVQWGVQYPVAKSGESGQPQPPLAR